MVDEHQKDYISRIANITLEQISYYWNENALDFISWFVYYFPVQIELHCLKKGRQIILHVLYVRSNRLDWKSSVMISALPLATWSDGLTITSNIVFQTSEPIKMYLSPIDHFMHDRGMSLNLGNLCDMAE